MQASTYFKHILFKKGEYIFYEGDVSESVYGLLNGKIAITKFIKNKKKAAKEDHHNHKKDNLILEEKELNILEPFNFFGEFGVINIKRRTANAKIIEESDLIFLDKDSFDITFKV